MPVAQRLGSHAGILPVKDDVESRTAAAINAEVIGRLRQQGREEPGEAQFPIVGTAIPDQRIEDGGASDRAIYVEEGRGAHAWASRFICPTRLRTSSATRRYSSRRSNRACWARYSSIWSGRPNVTRIGLRRGK